MSVNTEKTNKKEQPDPVTVQLKKLAEAVEKFSKAVESGKIKVTSERLR